VCSLLATVTHRQGHKRAVITHNIENEHNTNTERIGQTDATPPKVADITPASIAHSASQQDQHNIDEDAKSNEVPKGNSREIPTATPTTTQSPAHNTTETDELTTNNEDHETGREGRRQPPAMNTTNLRTNNVVFGHDLMLPKPDNTTHMVSININGVRRGNDYQGVLEMAQAFKTSSVDWAALTETNLDWRSTAKHKFYEKMQRVYHHAKISTSNSTIKYDTVYQPGGTLTMVTDNYTGRVTNMGADEELGWWSYTSMIEKHGLTILLVTIYKVCNQTGGGSRTAHTQQKSLLIHNGRAVSPRKAFIDDFDHLVTQWLTQGHELIIAGDLNEELGSDLSGFSRISSKHNLVEIIQQTHGIDGEPPTYAQGRRRLDYIFVTARAIQECQTLQYSSLQRYY
jgi:hypothetical protein